MGHRAIEIYRVTCSEFVIFATDLQAERALNHKKHLDPSVLVRLQFIGRNQDEFGIKRVQFALAGFEVEALKPVGTVVGTGSLGKALAFAFADDLDKVAIAVIVEEEFQANTEDHGNAQQRGQGWNEFAALDL